MSDREQIRQKILNRPIGDFISDCKEGLETANKHGDICACVSYANNIIHLEDIVDAFVAIDEETGGLITEG